MEVRLVERLRRVLPLLGMTLLEACSTSSPVTPEPVLDSDTHGEDFRPPDAGATETSPSPPVVPPPADAGFARDATPPNAMPPAVERGVRLVEGQLLVDGEPFYLRGVCYNPVPRGATHPDGVDFAGLAAIDIPLMQQAGINVIRSYVPLVDRAVLDALYAAGIRVINGIFVADGPTADAVALARSLMDHPAILMWSLGNEWNYNGLYVNLSHADALGRIADVAAALRAEDPAHPITTVYGELPAADTITALSSIDVWGINVYRGIGFDTLFADWAARSNKPMFVAEYGADAFNATTDTYDPASQALAVGELTGAIRAAGGQVLGGTVFEWADEWWKVGGGSPGVQDVGGTAPGGGPYPDGTFNEEWWGLVDIDRNPRPAYQSLREAFVP
jgi:exo-beta-1,3-glucanase (GH17 family)